MNQWLAGVSWGGALNMALKYGGRRDYRALTYGALRKPSGVAFTRSRGLEVVYDPMINQGTHFSDVLRERMHIRGLVPPSVQPLNVQVQRIVKNLNDIEKPIDKYSFLQQLLDRNVVLFYKVLVEHFSELAPIVYTPTVGQACQFLDLIYRRTKGMWFSVYDIGMMKSMTYNWPEEDVDVIVVTDGGRILGLGDLGSNGMAIPIGKLNLYVAGGGLHPKKTLPVTIDVGTDNETLLNNPMYLGVHRRRLEGEDYMRFVEEWMDAVTTRWPNACIQFEDFGTANAFALLEKYRDRYLCFNDDIQSTGCIALASVLASLRARGLSFGDLLGERIVIAGAGSAGLGVCGQIVQYLVDKGVDSKEAYARFWMLDHHGLIGKGRPVEDLLFSQGSFQRSDLPSGMGLLEVVRAVKPTILIGLSGAKGIFTGDVLREMSKHVERPVILPLSNPSDNSECTAEEVCKHTKGKAIFASGSPFPSVKMSDGKVMHTNQCNNIYSFPGRLYGALTRQGTISGIGSQVPRNERSSFFYVLLQRYGSRSEHVWTKKSHR
mmetsp:Transcript_36169/g.144581  ORF Transcript_36169/g.144581 Transcript_36169/m.144581 type:complete len:547 (-) Transcript_36169:1810-3450(-)